MDDSRLVRDIRATSDVMLKQGKILMQMYDGAGSRFRTNQYSTQISDFHDSSSKIRKLGVELVKSSAHRLEQDKQRIEEENQFKYVLLLVFVLIAFVFLIVIAYQSGKLSLSHSLTESLSEMSYVDALTRIGNRRRFDEEFEKEWKRSLRSGQSFSMLMIDVDFFKLFNDRYGHTAGDRCLKSIAQALRNSIKRPTDVLARYGGEEFVILLPETTDSEVVANTCRLAVEGLQIKHEDSSVSSYVTVSIGVGYITARSDALPTDSVREIDKALYRAKEQGRNRVVRA